MTRRVALFLFSLFAILLCSLTAVAQVDTTAIKGVCKDESGQPIAAANVEFADLDNGHKQTVKTGSHGDYYSLTAAGTYKVSLVASDGKLIASYNKVPVKPSAETVIDFDLAKLKADAEKHPSEEQRKQAEKINKENEKIQGINALLKQAIQQKKDKQYAAAVATMEQAAAQDQTHDVVYGSLADAYLLDKKFPQAEAAYGKAIALAPASANSKVLGGYHAGLALALLQQGKTEPSMAECDKTAQLDPTQAGLCYFNVGAILTNQGNTGPANQAFDKAIEADPSRADAYYQKGINLLAKATLGPDNKMIPAPGTADALNKYLELAPDGQYAQSAKDLLASIGASVQTSFGTPKKSGKK